MESDNGRYRLTVDQQFAGAARLTGSLEGQAVSSVWSEIEVEGAFEVECDELEICRSRVLDRPSEGALADALNELGGNVEAMLRLSGSLQSPRLSGPAVAVLTGVSGLPPIDLTLDLSGDRAGLEVAGVTGGFGQNSVTGGARIVWENGALSGRFNGEVHPEDFAPLVPDGWVPPAGTVQFEALLEGTLDSPQLFTDATGNVVLQPMFAGTEDEIPIGGTMAVDISGEVFREPHLAGVQHIDDFVWGDTRLGDGILDVLIDPSTASFGIELFELGARGSVDLTLTDERLFRGEFNVTSDGETTNLARLGEALGLPLSGELFLEGVAVGSLDSLAEMTAEVELMLRNGRFGDHLLALRPLSAVLHYAPTGISIDDVALHLGESVLSVSGGLTPDGTGTLTAQANAAGEGILGVMASIPGSERWLPELEMTGTIRMDTVTTGWINAPVIEGRLEVESDQIGLGDHPPFEQVDLRLSFREGIADVEAISAKWQDSAITGSGSFPISLWADRLPAAFVETLPPDGRATLSETSVETFDDIDFFTVADVTGLTLEQRVRPRPALTFAYSYSLERNHSFDPNARSNDPFAFDIIRRIARLAGTVIIDTRDDVFDASRGWFHSSSLEYAPESLGSQFRFTKYSVQQFHYWPIGREIVVATAARAALAQAFGQDLDLRERFFAGDGNTVRGYRQDSLGPLFRGQPDGGNALVVLNQEVRFPIFGITRGVGFVDAGNVFPLLENFDITDLKVGAGIGLRLATPFGLFRFDFATPLSKIEDERRSRFFFSIGQIF